MKVKILTERDPRKLKAEIDDYGYNKNGLFLVYINHWSRKYVEWGGTCYGNNVTYDLIGKYGVSCGVRFETENKWEENFLSGGFIHKVDLKHQTLLVVDPNNCKNLKKKMRFHYIKYLINKLIDYYYKIIWKLKMRFIK